MDRTEEKLQTFSAIVLKEAARKRSAITDRAEKERQDRFDSLELQLLEGAHQAIQETLRQIGKNTNEEISRTILESKQTLFTRREEIISGVFSRVKKRLEAFRNTTDYQAFLKKAVMEGFQTLGDGDVQVVVGETDMALMISLEKEMSQSFDIGEADDPLDGGCLFINRTTSRMCDFSLRLRFEQERQTFLDRYELSLDG